MMQYVISEEFQDKIKESEVKVSKINEIQKDLDLIEERYVFDKISKEQYLKFKTKLEAKKDGKVDLTIDPQLDNEATTIQESIPRERPGFFKRLFGYTER